MTAEEIAWDVVHDMGNEVLMPHLWVIKIKKAIEAEHEACAKIADSEAGYCRKGQAHGAIGSEMYSYHRAAEKTARRIAREIRARSETKTNGG